MAAAIACSGALLLILQSKLTFQVDDWEILLQRRGFSAGVFLDSHLDHIAIAPVAIYKTLLSVFGMRSALPFFVVSTLVFLLSVVLLFVYLRRRVGDWPALLGSILILFLGAAWSDLLWSFQICYFGSVAAGLGALLALERDDRRGDLFASALLIVAISFSELGVPFAVGALASVALGPSPRRGRFYVPLLPVALYGLWYLVWGQVVYHYDRLHNFLNSPRFVFDAISENFASLFGLTTPLNGTADVNLIGLTWGRILFMIAIPLAIWRLWRVGWRSRWLWVALATGAAFWFLTALNANPLREPTASRFQYPGAIFVLLIAAELLRGVRVGRRALAAATVVTVLAAASGVIYLHDGYKWRKVVSDLVQVQLGALEIARGHVSGNSAISSDYYFFGANEHLRPSTAGDYFSAADAFGSPAFSESQLAANRYAGVADQLLVRAEGLNLLPVPPAVAGGVRAQRCRTLDADPSGLTMLPLAPGDYTLRSRGAPEASLEVARFADKPWVTLGSVHRGAAASLTIPSDHSTRPWRLSSLGPSAVTVCTVTGSGSFGTPSTAGGTPSAVAACFRAAGVLVSGPQPAGPGTAVYVYTRSPRVATEGFVKAPNATIAAQLRRTFAPAGSHTKTLRSDPTAFGFYRGTLTKDDSALLSKCVG